jgi:hypothetical protein
MSRAQASRACWVLCALLGCSEQGASPATPTPAHPSGGVASAASGASSGSSAGSAASGKSSSDGGSSGGMPAAAGSSVQSEAGAFTGGQGGTDSGCPTPDLRELSVFSPGWDALGYPPYALDGCKLVYVAPEAGAGALHLRDLASGEDVLLEPPQAMPRRPTLAGDVIAWEVDDAGKSRVRVSYLGLTKTLGVELDHAGEPRATTDAVVFTAFLGSADTDDTDVYLYDVLKDELAPIATGPAQQRFADVSPTHVAVTDFSEDPRGYFDERDSLADVLVIERASGVRIPRAASGKQAFPLLGSDGALVYLAWGAVHPEPKFSQYWLKAGNVSQSVELDRSLTLEQVQTNPAYVRPSVRENHVDFVDTRDSVVGLYRKSLDSDAEPTAAPLSGSAQLLGPVAGDSVTLISKPLAGQALELIAVER